MCGLSVLVMLAVPLTDFTLKIFCDDIPGTEDPEDGTPEEGTPASNKELIK